MNAENEAVITVPCAATEQDVDTWQRLTLPKKRTGFWTWAKWVTVALCAAVTVACCVLWSWRGQGTLAEAIIAGILTFVAFIAAQWTKQNGEDGIATRHESVQGKYAYLLAQQSVSIGDSGVTVQSTDGTETFDWRSVKKILQTTSGTVYFAFAEGKACIVPIDAFDTRFAATQFFVVASRIYTKHRRSLKVICKVSPKSVRASAAV